MPIDSLTPAAIEQAAHSMGCGARDLLALLGVPDNDELRQKTPGRVTRAFQEFLSGYAMDASGVLGKVFEGTDYDEVVMVRNIEFSSMCEHHLLPFFGKAHVGYLPEGNRIVGLSKLARVVDVFARRLQVQERLTTQVAQALTDKLKPAGVAVVLEASHGCMGCRGVRQANSSTITSVMTGKFRDANSARAEIMSLIRG